MEFKFNPKQLLPIAAGILSIASMVVSNKMQANERETMKKELKDELLGEMLKK